MVRFFCFGNSKMVFALLTKFIAGHVVITLINVRKVGLDKMFTKIFCSYRSGFYYYSNVFLYFLICINF